MKRDIESVGVAAHGKSRDELNQQRLSLDMRFELLGYQNSTDDDAFQSQLTRVICRLNGSLDVQVAILDVRAVNVAITQETHAQGADSDSAQHLTRMELSYRWRQRAFSCPFYFLISNL